MKAVFDANIILSALIKKGGVPDQLIKLWREENAFTLLISDEIINEIDRVIRYPQLVKYHKLSEDEMVEFVSLLRKNATLIEPKATLSISTDESDNRYIECAVEGGAEYIITGDKKHLLPIEEHAGVKIVTARTFLLLIQF